MQMTTKFHETHFEEYLTACQKEDLHPKLSKVFKKFPKQLKEFKNLIFFGPPGVGKYTQFLKSVKKYSPSELKYEKKISITFNKQSYLMKISDIHYEVDMSLLGCNSKLLWHDIYMQIVDILSAKADKSGIILCKGFHEIHSELLENFYSYMQQNNYSAVDIKFVFITEHISFLPDNILNCCEVIHLARPSKIQYGKCIGKKLDNNCLLENITNIKNLHEPEEQIQGSLQEPHKIICDKIVEQMEKLEDLNFLKFRDLLYDIFIYNLDITQCVWYILSRVVMEKKIKQEKMTDVLIKTFLFFQYYNNNYRPIYHIENYIYFLIQNMHSL
jgi:DNA polymerase III delta prime subunit